MRTMMIASALALAWSVPALGQPANFKCPANGTLVEYSDSSWTKWGAAQANFCTLVNRAPNGTEVTFDWYAPTIGRRSDQSMAFIDQIKPAQFWPLTVGKTVTVRFNGGSNFGTSVSDITTSVDGQERVTTKAGTFDTFIVTQRVQAIGGTYKNSQKQWYAPSTGTIVKFEFSDSNGQSRKGEATSIKK